MMVQTIGSRKFKILGCVSSWIEAPNVDAS